MSAGKDAAFGGTTYGAQKLIYFRNFNLCLFAKPKLHGVFETSFDWKECLTERFIQQKLDYIHFNPCKARMVDLPEQ